MGDIDEKAILTIVELMEEADLKEGQDYKIVEGQHTKFDDGQKHGIKITRSYTRIYDTGFEKLGKVIMERDERFRSNVMKKLDNIEALMYDKQDYMIAE